MFFLVVKFTSKKKKYVHFTLFLLKTNQVKMFFFFFFFFFFFLFHVDIMLIVKILFNVRKKSYKKTCLSYTVSVCIMASVQVLKQDISTFF